jgi:hypothetical protein
MSKRQVLNYICNDLTKKATTYCGRCPTREWTRPLPKNKTTSKSIFKQKQVYKNGIFYNEAQFLLGGLIKIKSLLFWSREGALSNCCFLPLSQHATRIQHIHNMHTDKLFHCTLLCSHRTYTWDHGIMIWFSTFIQISETLWSMQT